MDFGAAMFFTDYSMTPVELGQALEAREVAHTSAAEMCSAIQSSAASVLSPTRTIRTFEVPGGRIGREPLETTKTFSRRRAATR